MQNINVVFEYLNESKNQVTWPNGINKYDNEKYQLNFFNNYGLHEIFQDNKKINNLHVFSLKDLEDRVLPENEKYLYFLEIQKPWMYPVMFKDKEFFIIPQRIINDVKSNRAKIVIFLGYEGPGFYPDDFGLIINHIKYLIDINNLPSNGIVYVDGNYLCEAHLNKFDIKAYYYNLFQNSDSFSICKVPYHRYNSIKESITNKTLRPKKYLCFNRAPREHRSYLVEKILKNNLLKNAIVTHCHTKYAVNFELNPTPYNIEVDMEYLKQHTPLVYDIVEIKNINPNYIDVETQLKCYFNIVTETWFLYEPSRMYYSEKIFKPITCLQPFIIVGQPYSLKYLKQMGFKTFNDFIDESYDEEIDPVKRLDKIVELTKKIYNMSQTELSDMLYKMLPILDWNYNHNITLAESERSGRKFLNRIINEWD